MSYRNEYWEESFASILEDYCIDLSEDEIKKIAADLAECSDMEEFYCTGYIENPANSRIKELEDLLEKEREESRMREIEWTNAVYRVLGEDPERGWLTCKDSRISIIRR